MGKGERQREGTETGYRGPQTCKIVGISYRQLDHWARTGLVKPSLQEAKGSGTQRLYSFQDLVRLRVIKSLIDAGVDLRKIRKAIDYLATHLDEPLEETTLISDGNSIWAATKDREIIDLMRNGQAVFGLALGKVFEDLHGSLATMAPETVEGAEPVDAQRATPRRRSAR